MNAFKQIDIVSPEFKANPFPFFEKQRSEQPVFSTILPDKTSVWLLTRYDDVNALLKDTRFAKNKSDALAPELHKQPWIPRRFSPFAERNMLDLDQPDHTRLRSLVHKAFTPHLIDKMRMRVQSLADDLLEQVVRKGEMDLICDYALPLPLTLITEILGVPTADLDKVYKWSKVIVSGNPSNNNWGRVSAIWQFNHYLRQFFKVRRADPKDDLVSALIQAEEAGDKLSEEELLAMVFLILVAGHETTVNLIGNGTLTLLQHPEQLENLRRDPALIKPAVEELLRYTSPVFMSTERYAREDVSIHGATIRRGEMAFGVVGSANRDETVFENSNDLAITRNPNKHLSFGQGIHFCLGAPLARLEAQIAINTLLRRMPDLQLRDSIESLRWSSSLILRGLESLPVKI